jgi:lysozyme
VKATRELALEVLKEHHVTDKIALIGVRSEHNKRGIYDDLILFVTPTKFEVYKANCDPSIFRTGIASLQTGVWRYKQGIHHIGLPEGNPRRYPALVQAAPVTVMRDGGHLDTGYFGINIHRGSITSTSSEGCQTIYPTLWEEFRNSVFGSMDYAKVSNLPYCLINADKRFE